MNSVVFYYQDLRRQIRDDTNWDLCTTIPIPMKFVSFNVVFPASYMITLVGDFRQPLILALLKLK